jgi:hypothetical protein
MVNNPSLQEVQEKMTELEEFWDKWNSGNSLSGQYEVTILKEENVDSLGYFLSKSYDFSEEIKDKELINILEKELTKEQEKEGHRYIHSIKYENEYYYRDEDKDYSYGHRSPDGKPTITITWSRIRKEKIIDAIAINSTGDNSIPYEVFDMIERKFDATRFHLG